MRLHKKLYLPLELVGATGRSRTETFDMRNSESQLKWKFKFPQVEAPGPKLMKIWNQFKQWIVGNDYHTVYDFKEMMRSTFKIANGETMCRYETEEGAYEYYKRKEESENYFETEEPQEMLDWKSILVRKFKGRVVKIISTLGVEVEPSTELTEQPFSD